MLHVDHDGAGDAHGALAGLRLLAVLGHVADLAAGHAARFILAGQVGGHAREAIRLLVRALAVLLALPA